ncbi:ATP-binding protein [Actinomadura craniellae]|uniref:ATP-binding protein n=1 Tax=Actinomadura craniellae TaxID=2231787 RepID=UPI001F256565|nr:ATP-binding protein [Actinomadura craniellae]
MPVPESDELPPYLESALASLISEWHDPSFTVTPELDSVTAARHFATRTLGGWDMGALADDVGLVVTELVTNALRHSLPPCPKAAERTSIRLRLLRQYSWVLCGIMDAASSAPMRREPDFVAETGRGLHLVDSFSARWGWRGLAPGGKVVWALFHVPA